ncbi:hypothetical protein P5W04_22195 [Mycobacteroides abscessus subsp. abscessus]|jgi:hypothetical protein|uniref:hypothetical protein n=1 Tax=Mycolicibacterium fortuitum TaxID=1766 RepID=UPI0007ED76EA|nr:hypothetical protein [Mycolicibacterium fortuitum]MDO3242835.1 hypothetical protein [Mycobacteroides abscessus subsp. abscessus]MCA4751389.1 hypothetical protein [Mycolicibacterium fortuitum]MDG5769789.1 hypothetical protein [Mycolicibacterium fortuitum]MDG5784813.1 hypothetical protein [Mycolicibacterium fortuitum]OBK13521.1 hypothetical protein A5637_02195 [Mycolicibacterium fortuitum]
MAEDVDTSTADFTPLFDTGENVVVDEALSGTPPAEDMTPDQMESDDAPSAPLPAPVPSVVVEGSYLSVKWWTFVGVLAGVWFVSAAAGAGLYYYWYQSVDKTWPVFVVLAYVVITTVGALVASTAQRKPVISALAIALMSAPLAAMAAAAVFYGAYVFGWIAR